ncbi:MAG: glutathione S-transferase family protein [Litorimonas sp.]
MFHIYYHPLSFPSLAPVFTASAMNADYQLHLVDLANGEQSSAEYLAINPFGKVPAMKNDNVSIGESAAIMRYMARKSNSDLYPQNDVAAQAKVDQWVDYVNHHVRGPVARVHFNRKLAPLFGLEPDLDAIATGEKMLEANLPILEKTLSETAFLCGETMSLADVALVAALEPVEMSNIDMSAYKTLSAWRTARRSEAFYTKVHSHYGAELDL